MNAPIELAFVQPNNPYDIRNLSDDEFNVRNLAFDQDKKDSWEQILRFLFEQVNSH